MRYEIDFEAEPFEGYTEFDEVASFDAEQGGLEGEIEQESSFRFDDCTDTEKKAIQAAFKEALKYVNHAAAVLGTIYGRPDKMTAPTRNLLNKHFHTANRSDVLKIFRTMFRLSQTLQKGLNFECEAACGKPGTCGYAWATQWFGGYGDIHLCFDGRARHCSFTNLSVREKAAVIIHEAAHRHTGIDDKAYIWERKPPDSRDYTKLTPKQAMDNADSYAWFAVEL